MIDEFISSVVKEFIEGIIQYDAPEKLSKSAREAMTLRITPYRLSSSLVSYGMIVYLIGVIIFLIVTPEQPSLCGGSYLARFALYMLSYTLGAGLLNLLLSGIIRSWRFADFHEACAYRWRLGPGGLSIALTLWGLFLTSLLLIGMNL